MKVRPDLSSTEYLYLALFTTVVWSIVAEQQEVTSLAKVSAENTGLRACFAACGITYVVDIIALFLVHQLSFSRSLFIVSALALFSLSMGVRTLFRILLRTFSEHRPAVRVLIVGVGRFASRVVTRIERNELIRCHVVGYVQLPGEEIRVSNGPVFQLNELEAIENLNIDDILIAIPLDSYGMLRRVATRLEALCRPIRVIVNIDSGVTVRNRVIQMGHLQMLDLDPSPMSSMGYFLVKRGFDFVFAIAILTLLAVPMALIAITIKMTSRGPILFRQLRIGRNGKAFTMYKFRSMRVASRLEGDTKWTTQDDPRRTWCGEFLRKTSLDELPQFFNVLKGEMSIVGPRPERPHFVKKFRREIALYQTRHHLNVGITGWAQVNGLRGDTSIQRRVRYDLYYLQHWSLSFDLKIICMTIWSGFAGKNAY
jgi:Undecaprenyl-phosphate glucose phosphotransferase